MRICVDVMTAFSKRSKNERWYHMKRIRNSLRLLQQTLIAGGLAGAVSRTAVAPLERLKIMYQVQHSRPPGVLDALTRIYRVEGFRASQLQIQCHVNKMK